jgi:hypothetical protein
LPYIPCHARLLVDSVFERDEAERRVLCCAVCVYVQRVEAPLFWSQICVVGFGCVVLGSKSERLNVHLSVCSCSVTVTYCLIDLCRYKCIEGERNCQGWRSIDTERKLFSLAGGNCMLGLLIRMSFSSLYANSFDCA